MKGSVFKRCQCTKAALGVDPETGKQKTCRKRHGSWALMLDVGIDPVTQKRKQLQRSGFATARDAEEALAELATGVTAGTWTDDKGTTVAGWLDTWLARKESNGLRPATVKIYRQHIDDYLAPSLGALRLRDLRPGHVASLLDTLQSDKGKSGKPLSTSTVTRVHACLRSALGTAVKMRLVTFNAARDVELPKVKRARVKPWQPSELGAFLDSVQADRLASLFEVVAASGMRRGEVCGLRWQDLDMKRGIITVRQQLTERAGDNSECPTCQENHKGLRFATPKTESGEYRKIELDGVTAGVLLGHQLAQSAEREEWGPAYSDHDLVFCRENGKPLSPGWVSDHFHRLTDAVKVPADPEKPKGKQVQLRRVRLHDLRHGQASLMLAAGVDMNVISKRLGHARSSFTADTYAHMLDGVGREAAEKAAALIPRRRTESV